MAPIDVPPRAINRALRCAERTAQRIDSTVHDRASAAQRFIKLLVASFVEVYDFTVEHNRSIEG
jgi:hypothetical protein